jgi:hypothetical protein
MTFDSVATRPPEGRGLSNLINDRKGRVRTNTYLLSLITAIVPLCGDDRGHTSGEEQGWLGGGVKQVVALP